MALEKAKMFDMALDKMLGDLDDVEGKSAMSHSMEDCPDPLNCNQHDSEAGSNLAPEEVLDNGNEPAAVKIEVHKLGLPSLEGKSEGPETDAEQGKGPPKGLSDEEIESLKKLLKK